MLEHLYTQQHLLDMDYIAAIKLQKDQNLNDTITLQAKLLILPNLIILKYQHIMDQLLIKHDISNYYTSFI